VAEITASIQELIDVMVSNNIIPHQITDITAEDNGISFIVKTNLPIISAVPLKAEYIAYEHKHAHIKVCVYNLNNKLVNKAINKLVETFSRKMGDAVTIRYPSIFINVNGLLDKKIQGIVIKDIACEDGFVQVVTQDGGLVY